MRIYDAAVGRWFSKKVFFKIPQYSLLCWTSFCNFIKKRLQQNYFPVNIAKFNIFFTEHLRWLLLICNAGTCLRIFSEPSVWKGTLKKICKFLSIKWNLQSKLCYEGYLLILQLFQGHLCSVSPGLYFYSSANWFKYW